MVASRLSDSQKNDIVGRYRAGETSTELARSFGCSANTISRVVKTALDPAEYERLKQGRGRTGRAALAEPSHLPALATDALAPGMPESDPAGMEADAPGVSAEAHPGPDSGMDEEDVVPSHGRRLLAIDDADDFDDEAESDGDSDDDANDDDANAAADTAVDDDAPDLAGADPSSSQPMVVPVLPLESELPTLTCRPLAEAVLPDTAYLLVDKLVELQAQPLREFTDLGPIPEEEAELQTLMLFVNPRQAKRHCGRNQRVIQLPDPSLLRRTAPYLVAQGISRVVIEGNLFALTEPATT